MGSDREGLLSLEMELAASPWLCCAPVLLHCDAHIHMCGNSTCGKLSTPHQLIDFFFFFAAKYLLVLIEG